MAASLNAQDQIADLMADAMPQQILAFKLSSAIQIRIELLAEKKKEGLISEKEREELDKYLTYDLLIGLAKARAYKHISAWKNVFQIQCAVKLPNVQTIAANTAAWCPKSFWRPFFILTILEAESIKGRQFLSNLAYACPHCNQNKGSDIATFVDDENELTTRFFNPRKDIWHDHFEINYGEILHKSVIGKATVAILDFNQIERIMLRQALISINQYP